MILAHGLGGRSDLPVPLWIAVTGAVLALLVSFAALSFFWKKPRFVGPGGKPLPTGLGNLLDAPSWFVFWRLVGLIAFVLTLSAAWLGPNVVTENPAPAWIYVFLWVGLFPLSLVFGPFIKRISPLRTIAAGISSLLRGHERLTPTSWGMWPAAISLFTFVWVELVSPNAAVPRFLAAYMTIYAVIHIAMGVVYGQDWFEQGEGFEVASTLVGRMAPFARSEGGTWVVRNPMHGLSQTPPVVGLVAMVAVLLGSTAFDGLTRTPVWRDWSLAQEGFTYLASGTAGLLGSIVVVALVYGAAMQMTQSWAPDRPTLAADFAPSLVPIAIGYTVAHYFSFTIFDGQLGLILASDPYGLGWNLFGTAGNDINYTLISTEWIALIQVAAIALGHVAGVVIAHDKALQIFPKRHHMIAQYPLLCAMVAFTMSGISLVVGSANSLWLMISVAVFIPMAALFVWILAPVDEPEVVEQASR